MLASVIREVIAPALLRCPKECGITSITEVEVSEDFSHATVFVSALEHPEAALKFLESILPELKTAVGSLYRSRIPELRFKIDPRIEKGNAMDDLLR